MKEMCYILHKKLTTFFLLFPHTLFRNQEMPLNKIEHYTFFLFIINYMWIFINIFSVTN